MIVVGTEKNFAALRPRLFEGKVSSKAAGEVSAAIRRPTARRPEEARAGTVLRSRTTCLVSVRGVSLDDPSKHAATGLVTVGSERSRVTDRRSRAPETAAARKQIARTLSGTSSAARRARARQSPRA
jgi:hypothetical protein